MTSFVLSLPRFLKQSIVVGVDTILCIFGVWFAYYLRLGEFIYFSDIEITISLLAVIIALPVFHVFGLYRVIFRHSRLPALLTVGKAIAIYGFLYASIITVIGIVGVPRTIGLIQPTVLLLTVAASRILASALLNNFGRSVSIGSSRQRVMIYGAGLSGRQLADALVNSTEMKVVGFLDDDKLLHRSVINGLIVRDPLNIRDIKTAFNLDCVLLAMPGLKRKRRNDILNQMIGAQVLVRTLPSFTDLVQGKVTVSDIRELDTNDLLGREPISPNKILLAKNITNKVIMITGAGGSIGSELCRQIIGLNPKAIVLIEHNEFALYRIHQELENKDLGVAVFPLLASVQDEEKMDTIFSSWKPQTVYHAAAYKHVPLVEHNVVEGLKNNVLGTLRTARAAIKNEVEQFVLISTDKAVRPTNIMGASKRLAEIALQVLTANKPATKFSMVRFGNVLGSSGSVVPKFREQINNGGPVTITHPEIIRYFMSIEEAAQLVIQAGAMTKGGEVFILDMGQAVKIAELARRMIELSGMSIKDSDNPDGDIEIKVTGLRPGEKLYEELLIENNPVETSHKRILKANERFPAIKDIHNFVSSLNNVLNSGDVENIRSLLVELVPDYIPSGEIVDWVERNKFSLNK